MNPIKAFQLGRKNVKTHYEIARQESAGKIDPTDDNEPLVKKLESLLEEAGKLYEDKLCRCAYTAGIYSQPIKIYKILKFRSAHGEDPFKQ